MEPPIGDGGELVDAGDVDPKDGGPPPPEDAGPDPDPNCGNGVPEGTEQCDDGNTVQTDGCKNNCTYNICGDTYIYEGTEDCDDGNTNNGDGCSAVCLTEAPPLPDYVEVSGQVKSRKYADGSIYNQYITVRALGAQLCVDTANAGQYKACAAGGPTDATGSYSINYIQPASTFYFDLRIDDALNQDPNQPGGSWVTRYKASTQAEGTETVNPYYAPFGWVADVADACGVYAAGTFNKDNQELVQRTIVLGHLKDRATGNGIAGVTKDQIKVRIKDYVNENPAYVCFLNVSGNELVGTDSTTSYAESGGAFIVFKLVNQQGGALGDGNAYVSAGPGFDEASVGLAAGNLGMVTLYSDGDVPPPPPDLVNFDTQIYPLFTTLGCVNCHYENGPADNNNNGYYARFDLQPAEVHQNLVGPGTNCTVATGVGNYRVCLNDPEASRFLVRPLLEDPPDHPNASFPDKYDPNYLTVKAWIEQGAQRVPVVEPDPLKIYTLYGVMDVASNRCIACHGYDVDYGATGRPAGYMPLNGCGQYWIDNGAYTAAGVDYDSATNPNYKRDCVYYHLKNAATRSPDPYYAEYAADAADSRRVNVAYPEHSMLLRNPYCGLNGCADDPTYPETHPTQVFPNTDDPGYQAIHSWIVDGATNNGDADNLYFYE